ncbi:MAG: YhgN family NAAT transporter [Xanthomonadales bacterium]|nr:YhgN family NAAT transporter [Xanthomonadales bacterium]
MTTLAAAILLFVILDPLGNVPVFLSLMRGMTPQRQRRVLARELLIALAVLFLFLFAGNSILSVMHLREESVAIAGGIVLFLISIKMIFPAQDGVAGHQSEGEPFIVPMAIPLIAGPSGMAAVILLASNEPHRLADWSLALFMAWTATAAILFSATFLYKVLGRSVLVAVERLMGMLLVAVSVQMLLDGVKAYLGGA